MSKSLSVATAIEKNLLASDTPFLCLLDIEVVDPTYGVVVETLHYVRNSEDVEYNGDTYVSAPFELDIRAEAGAQPQTVVRITDITREIQARMQAYGGGVGFNVTIYVINGDELDQPAEVIEYFQVVGANADTQSYVVSFTLGAENAIVARFPKRRQTHDFCQWRYKDPETCGYAGGMPSCDLTLQGPNGCAAHGNNARFGGFPGINQNGMRYA